MWRALLFSSSILTLASGCGEDHLSRLHVDTMAMGATSDTGGVGDRQTTGGVMNGVAVTTGTIRVRRRHENDLDFSKYNPFYWSGRIVKFRIEDYTPSQQNRLKFVLE